MSNNSIEHPTGLSYLKMISCDRNCRNKFIKYAVQDSYKFFDIPWWQKVETNSGIFSALQIREKALKSCDSNEKISKNYSKFVLELVSADSKLMYGSYQQEVSKFSLEVNKFSLEVKTPNWRNVSRKKNDTSHWTIFFSI